MKQVVFTCRVPEKHRAVFENYIMIQVLAAQADATIDARMLPSKRTYVVTTHICGESMTALERARSRISGRAISLAQIEGG